MLGYKKSELLKLTLHDLTHPDDLAESKANITRLLSREINSFTMEKRYVCKDGTLVWAATTVSLIDIPEKKAQISLAIIKDISDRKKAEIKLQQTNKKLARATRMKDEFLANMSHELRTPLNAILGMTEGLQEKIFGNVNERQLKALKTIEDSGLHLLELINEILDLAKIESGNLELNYNAVTVTELCQSSLTFIKQQAKKKNIQLQQNIPVNLPEIEVDERRIRQVLINLLNNAIKFTPAAGKVTLEVRNVKSDETSDKNYISFAVKDTGIGIPVEKLNLQFKPFVQIDSACNRQYKGTGLGLALVKKIVELHEGQVEVSSEVGVGSCFVVKLPFTTQLPSRSDQSQAVSESGFSIVESKTLDSPLILLAEDNEANINTLSSYLRAKGYRIQVAKNGRAAIEQVEVEFPSIILMDIQMPEVDGLTAIRQIRQLPKLALTPIIALTALAMEGDRERCLVAGANMYLSKPVKLKKLSQSINQLLTKS